MRQISGEGNAAAQAECVLRRHGGGKPEGNEYYRVERVEEGAVPEKTINTLPVKERA